MIPDSRAKRLDLVFRVALVALALLWALYPPSAQPGSASTVITEARR